jgi:hypothetical protein
VDPSPLAWDTKGGGFAKARAMEQEFDLQRSFSPNGTLVRKSSPINTTTVEVENGCLTQVSPLTSSTVQRSRELLLRVYLEKASSHTLTKQDKMNIAAAAKDHVLGRIKFILPNRMFPSFWQPHLHM